MKTWKIMVAFWTLIFSVVLTLINCQGLTFYMACAVNVTVLLAYLFCVLITLDDNG